MTFKALRCFCAVVEFSGFHRAAERLHKTQPGITRQVKALERELGHVLFDRKAAQPTEAGKIVYERGLVLLNGSDSLLREIGDFDEGAAQTLRLGCSDTNALYFLPRYIREFSGRAPRTHLVVVTRSSADIAEEVARGTLDLGIVTLPVEQEALEAKELFEQRLVLVVPKSHALAAKKTVGLSRLRHEAFVLLDEKTRTGWLLREYFREHEFQPQIAMDSGSFEIIKRYVEEGIGISILPEMVVGESRWTRLRTVGITGLPGIAIGVVWRRGAYQSNAARAFLELIGAHRAQPASRP